MIDLYGWIKVYSHDSDYPYLIHELKLIRGKNQALEWTLMGRWCSRLPIVWSLEVSECDLWTTQEVKVFKKLMAECLKLSDEVWYMNSFNSIPYEELPLC